MNGSPRPVNPNTSHRSLRWVAVVAAIVFVVLAAPLGTTKADGQQYAVVVRIDTRNARRPSSEMTVRIGNMNVPVTAIQSSPEVLRNIAIVIDAGPDQTKVLPKEKELAMALINELSDATTSFTIATPGSVSMTEAATLGRFAAIERLHDIAGNNGEKSNVPIYDAIASAIRQISVRPGLRVVIFIGEGSDGGSKMPYEELRSLAESNQIAFFAALVADHRFRGAKGILRYGWNLQDLSSDTVGIFLENEKTAKATRRLSEAIRGLRLAVFELPSRWTGRYKVSVSARRSQRLRAQKAIVIP